MTTSTYRCILSPVETPPKVRMERPICETYQDHEFGGWKFLEAGKHPVNGTFEKYVAICDRCGRKIYETRWTALKASGLGGVQP